jgi:hypothetical protein
MHAKMSVAEVFDGHWIGKFLLKEKKGKNLAVHKKYNLHALNYLSKDNYGLALGDINRNIMQDQMDGDAWTKK